MMINFENMAIQTEMKILSIDKDGVSANGIHIPEAIATFDDAKISAKAIQIAAFLYYLKEAMFFCL